MSEHFKNEGILMMVKNFVEQQIFEVISMNLFFLMFKEDELLVLHFLLFERLDEVEYC